MCSQQESQEHSPGKKLKGRCQINSHLCPTTMKAGAAMLSLMGFTLLAFHLTSLPTQEHLEFPPPLPPYSQLGPFIAWSFLVSR